MNINNFAIRTITAGVTLDNLTDTGKIEEAILFLKNAKNKFEQNGHIVQTLRVATNHYHQYTLNSFQTETVDLLKNIDEICRKNNVLISIGQITQPDERPENILPWIRHLIHSTNQIYFSVPVSSPKLGVHFQSIQTAAQIMVQIARNSPGGEGNFRFAAAANCLPGTPYFPVAYHLGSRGFTIGMETPNVITEIASQSHYHEFKAELKRRLEDIFKPIENLCKKLEKKSEWHFNGIDTSTAPGLNASIGESIETLTKHPFGAASTLSACSAITDVIKNLDVKTCGYSGLMLPVLEDKILARRAQENRYTLKELLLYSTVCGTGLDVIPLSGNTSVDQLARLLTDIAALSLKFVNKPLSARLLLIPEKDAGELVKFENPYLTTTKVMKID